MNLFFMTKTIQNLTYDFFFILFRTSNFLIGILSTSKNILSISLYQYYINFDRGILEHVGPLGVAFSTEKLSSSIISLQNGNVRSYLEFLVFTFFYFFLPMLMPT